MTSQVMFDNDNDSRYDDRDNLLGGMNENSTINNEEQSGWTFWTL